LKSRMYATFRSFERGALSSLRANSLFIQPVIRQDSFNKDIRSISSDYSVTKVPTCSNSVDSNRNSSNKNFSNKNSSNKNISNGESVSFTGKAFTRVGLDPSDRVLLHGSTWLSLLIAGVESCPIGFCMIATGKDRFGYPIVAANSYLQKSLGYHKSKIIGSSYNLMTGTDVSLFTSEMAAQMNQFHHAVEEGTTAIVEIAAKNSRDEYFETIVGMRPVFDQYKKYRYMVMLFFNQKDGCTASDPEVEGACKYDEEYRMVALCHVHYLLELIGLIPNGFLDDDI
jgi:hypothetical protein